MAKSELEKKARREQATRQDRNERGGYVWEPVSYTRLVKRGGEHVWEERKYTRLVKS
ncbi:MAG TPA: hypothetical protein VJZ93_02965 [Candidatus Nanoarchaeia archaeon]|nr:hypothetical protein [Candidatus Nanoarchaeia archaeon]